MKKLLIVDDDLDMCLLLNLYLTREGFKVSEAHSSKEALSNIDTIHQILWFVTLDCRIWMASV